MSNAMYSGSHTMRAVNRRIRELKLSLICDLSADAEKAALIRLDELEHLREIFRTTCKTRGLKAALVAKKVA